MKHCKWNGFTRHKAKCRTKINLTITDVTSGLYYHLMNRYTEQLVNIQQPVTNLRLEPSSHGEYLWSKQGYFFFFWQRISVIREVRGKHNKLCPLCFSQWLGTVPKEVKVDGNDRRREKAHLVRTTVQLKMTIPSSSSNTIETVK